LSLFLFLFQVLNLPLIKARYGPNSYAIALLATIIWAINPVQTQAVTYIVQRMASMAGMFYIMSMAFYVKGRISEKSTMKYIFFFLFFLSGILAIGTKENAIMLPMSVLFLDLFLIQGLTRQNIQKSVIIFFGLILVLLILTLILYGPSKFSLSRLTAPYGYRGFTLSERLLTEPRVLLFYISLLLYPIPSRLSLSHDIAVSHNLLDPPTTILAILVLLLFVVLLILKSKKWPFICYCILFFFLNHIIESSIIPLELSFEHRNYLPSMLFFAPIAILAVKSISFFSNRRTMQVIFSIFIILLLISEGNSTFLRNAVWKTGESLWLDVVQKYPTSPRAHQNLGYYYGKRGEVQKEIEEYQIALNLKPGSHSIIKPLIHYSLGLAYLKRGESVKAENQLLRAVALDPRLDKAYSALGILYMGKEDYDRALFYFDKSLAHNKKEYRVFVNIGHIYLKKGNAEKAIPFFLKALDIEKNYKSALRGLGVAYKQKKEFLKAKDYFERALDQNRKNILTRLYLLEILSLLEDHDGLKAFLAETVELIPPEKMRHYIDEIRRGPFLYEQPPDLQVILPVLKEAYPIG
jgi:tetratricopeptide (TPR) repeat protein